MPKRAGSRSPRPTRTARGDPRNFSLTAGTARVRRQEQHWPQRDCERRDDPSTPACSGFYWRRSIRRRSTAHDLRSSRPRRGMRMQGPPIAPQAASAAARLYNHFHGNQPDQDCQDQPRGAGVDQLRNRSFRRRVSANTSTSAASGRPRVARKSGLSGRRNGLVSNSAANVNGTVGWPAIRA